MKVTLSQSLAPSMNEDTGRTTFMAMTVLTLEGSHDELQAGIDELFDADRANDLRRELGLKTTSASVASGRQ